MNADDRSSAEALDRYWDELVLDGHPPAAVPDGDNAALIGRLWALGAPPDANAARERVRRRLPHHIRKEERAMDATTLTRTPSASLWSPTNANDRVASRPIPPRGQSRSPGLIAHLATAAVLLLTLGGSLIAFGPLRPSGHTDRSATLPAIVAAPATSTMGITDEETLLRVSLPAAVIPHGDHIEGGLFPVTFPAQTTTTWEASAGSCCPGIRVNYFLSGTVTAQPEGPVQVRHANGAGSLEVVATGTEIVLGAGDALIFPNETTITYANAADAPVELLFWFLLDNSRGTNMTPPVPAAWIVNDAYWLNSLSVPDGPATLRVRQVNLTPNRTFPGTPDALNFVVASSANAAGTPVVPSLATGSDGTIRNLGRESVTVFIVTLESDESG